MSNNKEEAAATSCSKFSIVRAIVNLFKLGEEGKVEGFFEMLRRNYKRDIEKLDKKLEILEFNHKNSMEDLSDRIADAQLEVDNAFLNVDVDQLGTNAERENYAAKYWSKIELAEANLATLKEEQEAKVEAHEKEVKKQKEQIAERKRRLSKISEPAK